MVSSGLEKPHDKMAGTPGKKTKRKSGGDLLDSLKRNYEWRLGEDSNLTLLSYPSKRKDLSEYEFLRNLMESCGTTLTNQKDLISFVKYYNSKIVLYKDMKVFLTFRSEYLEYRESGIGNQKLDESSFLNPGMRTPDLYVGREAPPTPMWSEEDLDFCVMLDCMATSLGYYSNQHERIKEGKLPLSTQDWSLSFPDGSVIIFADGQPAAIFFRNSLLMLKDPVRISEKFLRSLSNAVATDSAYLCVCLSIGIPEFLLMLVEDLKVYQEWRDKLGQTMKEQVNFAWKSYILFVLLFLGWTERKKDLWYNRFLETLNHTF